MPRQRTTLADVQMVTTAKHDPWNDAFNAMRQRSCGGAVEGLPRQADVVDAVERYTG